MTTTTDTALLDWVQTSADRLGWPTTTTLQLQPLSGDAGFRRYFRVAGLVPPVLAVDAPPATENSALFIELADSLRRGGVHTPVIYAQELSRGWLLVEDFGDQLLWQSLQEQPENSDCLYAQALMELMTLQQLRPYRIALPSYSPAMLLTEMALMPEWFAGQLLGVELEPAVLEPIFFELVANALAQPQVLVHRDYHSRNLLEQPGQPLAVIDFQGAVWGPLTYDVVSLLKDCYCQWPRARVERWALCYAQLASDAGLLPAVDPAQFLRWFDLTGLQRHLKVLGIFARLALRDGKQGYLQDLPLVLHYVQETAGRYPELAALSELLAQLMPVIEQQPWYRPVTEVSE
ncbi:aminoglycoside phosphotransferase family protein [Halioxenophilus sp. WMMB6]|uniref:aminoglycoside phosphotransferase family protein n=1 Tax=Halioxenophilus sp. WMMB6 TaxID=3073815 RepID=UPI00295EE237|nr:phosphotransferase [Halioxenophilus sp. WMMB6]